MIRIPDQEKIKAENKKILQKMGNTIINKAKKDLDKQCFMYHILERRK